MNGYGLLAVGRGLFWFWERGRQGWAADLPGRDVARVLYGLLGAAVIVPGVMLDDVDTPAAAPVIAPFEQLQPANVLPDGFEVDGPVGTLICENEDGTRARTPAFEFDTARPLVLEYMELQGQLAERLTDDQLDAEITELRQTLQVLDADEELQEIRQSLQRLIESRPDTPAAAAARRALEQLEPGGGRNNQFFDLDSNS